MIKLASAVLGLVVAFFSQLVDAQITKYDLGMRHWNQTEYINIEFDLINFIETNDSAVNPSHGGASVVNITELNLKNNCTDFKHFDNSILCLCFDELYILSKTNQLARSNYLKLKPDEHPAGQKPVPRRFVSDAANGDSVVLITWNGNPASLEMIYVNTFDSTYNIMNGLMSNVQINLFPKILYFKLKTSPTFLVLFDSPARIHEVATAEVNTAEIFVMPTNIIGEPKSAAWIRRPIFSQEVDSSKVTMVSIIFFEERLFFFYYNQTRGRLQVSAAMVGNPNDRFDMDETTSVQINWGASITQEDQELRMKNFEVFQVNSDVVLFHFADMEAILVCKILISNSTGAKPVPAIQSCSKKAPSGISDYRKQAIFEVSSTSIRDFESLFALEVKDQTTRETLFSSYYSFDKSSFSLQKKHTWLIPAKGHFVKSSEFETAMSCFKGRYLETYLGNHKFLKIEFAKIAENEGRPS